MLRDQRGYTAIELLVASTIFIVVLVATLGPLDGVWRTTKINEQQNASQETARQAVDSLVSDLRSAGGQTQLVEKAGTSDLVFKAVDPLTNPSGSNPDNVKRVRYCLSGSTLYKQQQTWTTAAPPAVPSTTSCPDAAWTPAGGTIVATDIVNGSTALFLYDTATLANVKQVEIDVLADTTPGANPKTAELKTAVTLRNAN
jgi:Tfp pilus assembly protein PilW